MPFKELSEPKAVILTPPFNEKLPVYVPGLIEIVSPDDALASADGSVVCVPFAADASTINFEGP